MSEVCPGKIPSRICVAVTAAKKKHEDVVGKVFYFVLHSRVIDNVWASKVVNLEEG